MIDIVPTLDMYESDRHALRELVLPLVLPDPAGAAARADDRRRSRLLSALDARRVGQPRPRRSSSPKRSAEYERCFSRADTIHAACEDYRASASIDLEHDRASRAAGEKIACAMLVLWGTRGVVGRLYDPLALWRAQCAADGRGQRDGGRPLHPRGAARRHRRAARRLPGDAGALSVRARAAASDEGRRPANAFTLSPRASRRGAVYHRRHARGRSAHVRVDQQARPLPSDPLRRLGAVHRRLRRQRVAWWQMGMSLWLVVVFAGLVAGRPARRAADAPRDPAQLPGDRPPALPARVHPARRCASTSSRATARRRRSRASSARSSTSAPRASPTSGPFGTQLDVGAVGYEWINHSMQPTRADDARLPRR